MAQEQQTPGGAHVSIRYGARDQLAALERLWAAGQASDPEADDAAWQTLRHAMNESRRMAGARLLFDEEDDEPNHPS